MKNILINLYFYLRRGNAIVNEFKVIIAGIFAIYLTLKLTSPIFLVILTLIAVPCIIIVGYIYVKYVAKQVEKMDVSEATHWQQFGYDMQSQLVNYQRQTVEILKEIMKKIYDYGR